MMRHMPAALTARETSEVARANQSGKQPVVLIHGLWLLASSWDNWADLFEQAGYSAVKPGWPDDPETVDEAKLLYEKYAVPAPGKPLFQAAFANINPRTEVKVDTLTPDRGPMLLISGDKDNTVPWAIVNASYKLQKRNPGSTEVARIPNRGHSLTIDSGWRDVAETALAFVRRFSP